MQPECSSFVPPIPPEMQYCVLASTQVYVLSRYNPTTSSLTTHANKSTNTCYAFMVRKWEISDLRAFELQVGITFFIAIINVNDLV